MNGGDDQMNFLRPLSYISALRTVDFMDDHKILAVGFKRKYELQYTINQQSMLSED